jgi:bacillithiol biosynthesis cysteine-adding enzyme BshC
MPHTSALYRDHLFEHARVAEFYPHPANVEAVKEYARTLDFPTERRQRVAEILAAQNKGWGAAAKTLDNLQRLKNGAVAVLSGQQVGLFGGPLYSILKAVSAVQLAAELTASGIEAVPVFWLATEDHDLAEINHAWLPDGAGKARQLASTSHTAGAPPVGQIPFADEIEALAAEAASLLPEGEAAEVLQQCYRAGESFGSAFARLFTWIFREHGLILLDPLDAGLHKVSAPLMTEAASRAAEIDAALIARGHRLRAAGYHEQVRVTESSCLLFSLAGGGRTALQLAGDEFLTGTRRQPRQQVLDSIAQQPELYSPNVLLRPVVQDFLLPTVTYFGGPGEIAYFAQGSVVHQMLLGRVTPVLPRLSATLVSKRQHRLLQRNGLGIADLFQGLDALRRQIGERALPTGFAETMRQAEEQLQALGEQLQDTLRQLDPTLVGAAARATRKMNHQIARLGTKAAHAELRRNAQLDSDATELWNTLFPGKNLQERSIAGFALLAQFGDGMLDACLQAAATHQNAHHVIEME